MKAMERVQARTKRHRRVRKSIAGTAQRPRLTVYRSNRHIYGQVIDDYRGHTLAAASTLKDGGGAERKEQAKAVGKALATRAKKAGVTQVQFDRGGFQYHGRVQALAEGAREGGLEF